MYGPSRAVYPCNKVMAHEHIHGHLMLADEIIRCCEPLAFQLGHADLDDSLLKTSSSSEPRRFG